MHTILDRPETPAHDSLVEKKSEFIGDAAHIDTLDEALAFVESIRIFSFSLEACGSIFL